jgi:hypothetical protein
VSCHSVLADDRHSSARSRRTMTKDWRSRYARTRSTPSDVSGALT